MFYNLLFCILYNFPCSIEGEPSSDEAHKVFMENYKSIFVNGKPGQPGMLPVLGKDISGPNSLGATNNSTGMLYKKTKN